MSIIKEVFLSKVTDELNKFNLSQKDIRFIKQNLRDLDLKDVQERDDMIGILMKTKDCRVFETTDRQRFFDHTSKFDYSYFVLDISKILKGSV